MHREEGDLITRLAARNLGYTCLRRIFDALSDEDVICAAASCPAWAEVVRSEVAPFWDSDRIDDLNWTLNPLPTDEVSDVPAEWRNSEEVQAVTSADNAILVHRRTYTSDGRRRHASYISHHWICLYDAEDFRLLNRVRLVSKRVALFTDSNGHVGYRSSMKEGATAFVLPGNGDEEVAALGRRPVGSASLADLEGKVSVLGTEIAFTFPSSHHHRQQQPLQPDPPPPPGQQPTHCGREYSLQGSLWGHYFEDGAGRLLRLRPLPWDEDNFLLEELKPEMRMFRPLRTLSLEGRATKIVDVVWPYVMAKGVYSVTVTDMVSGRETWGDDVVVTHSLTCWTLVKCGARTFGATCGITETPEQQRRVRYRYHTTTTVHVRLKALVAWDNEKGCELEASADIVTPKSEYGRTLSNAAVECGTAGDGGRLAMCAIVNYHGVILGAWAVRHSTVWADWALREQPEDSYGLVWLGGGPKFIPWLEFLPLPSNRWRCYPQFLSSSTVLLKAEKITSGSEAAYLVQSLSPAARHMPEVWSAEGRRNLGLEVRAELESRGFPPDSTFSLSFQRKQRGVGSDFVTCLVTHPRSGGRIKTLLVFSHLTGDLARASSARRRMAIGGTASGTRGRRGGIWGEALLGSHGGLRLGRYLLMPDTRRNRVAMSLMTLVIVFSVGVMLYFWSEVYKFLF